MKTRGKVLAGIVIVFLLLQLIQPSDNDMGNPGHTEFKVAFNVPDNIGMILRASCFDCHSNSTVYPCMPIFNRWVGDELAYK
ncbi:heme-binding domain-containing protein [Pedobacter fastidiosus]|uniref:heme-binding domain-containing protein n=1 Tax=Pedobacter fastidiosus TaxID=2765361 RepID=UPI003609F214